MPGLPDRREKRAIKATAGLAGLKEKQGPRGLPERLAPRALEEQRGQPDPEDHLGPRVQTALRVELDQLACRVLPDLMALPDFWVRKALRGCLVFKANKESRVYKVCRDLPDLPDLAVRAV